MSTMYRYSLICLVGLCATAPASASWADGMFEEMNRDFGSVPRGPTLTHPFRVVNTSGMHVHIAGVRVSCGCTSARALQNDLAPGQETVILAQMDTRRFLGSKTVTIFVTFDQPRYEEVRLLVQANSREDVNVTPDTLALGRVKRTMSPSAATTIAFFGDPNWQITSVGVDSNYIQPTCKMVRRDTGEVAYELSVRLRPDTPVGKWFTDIWLTTNNPATPRVRVPLTVEIEPALSINPGTLALGDVKAGKETERKVIVRGATPFKITGIKGTDKEITVRDNSDEAKAIHVLTVKVQGKQPGDVSRTFHIATDVEGESDLEFTARARIIK
jgi:Protein of unknown function (DUF1573)